MELLLLTLHVGETKTNKGLLKSTKSNKLAQTNTCDACVKEEVKDHDSNDACVQ